jgi:phenylacetate-CoA ligase
MLIVRGVNVFPSAIREVVNEFRPEVSGHLRLRPRSPGVKQEPPLPIVVEATDNPRLADLIRERIRAVLIVQTEVELVPFGTLERSDYKAKLVEH